MRCNNDILFMKEYFDGCSKQIRKEARIAGGR